MCPEILGDTELLGVAVMLVPHIPAELFVDPEGEAALGRGEAERERLSGGEDLTGGDGCGYPSVAGILHVAQSQRDVHAIPNHKVGRYGGRVEVAEVRG